MLRCSGQISEMANQLKGSEPAVCLTAQLTATVKMSLLPASYVHKLLCCGVLESLDVNFGNKLGVGTISIVK